MSDRPVLAHYVLVLENDARPRPIVRRGVGPTDQIDHLIGLDGAGARIHRVRADPRQVVDLEGRNRTVRPDPDPSPASMIAGVDVRVETLDAVRHELDWPTQQLGQRVGRHFVGVDMDLDAERAADILADHPDLRFP
ncbi:hypothetical protein ACVMB1_004198 [Bradyrhizobium sp. USDA 4504]